MSEKEIKRLIRSVQNSSPASARESAVCLWDMGEKEIAFQAILAQFLDYKKPKDQRHFHVESSSLAALILGEFGDKRAIPYLVESLSTNLRFESAYALSLIGGKELEEALTKQAGEETVLAILTNLSLGYMCNHAAVLKLTGYLYDRDEIISKYSEGFAHSLYSDTLTVFGALPGEEGKELFYKFIKKDQLFQYLHSYCGVTSNPHTFHSKHKTKTNLRAGIVKKLGWDKYFKTENDIRSFIPTFKNEHLVPLQKKITDQIWNEIQDTEQAH